MTQQKISYITRSEPDTSIVESRLAGRNYQLDVHVCESQGEVIEAIGPAGSGRVATHGEIWSAIAGQPISQGARVRVVGIDGMTLTVSPEPSARTDAEEAQ